MMTGITSWQQQVPIPQCYTGTNAWSIPLNPVLADTPVPTATNFFRGAIALAANGVPIFNALTNTGADAYLAGQLDDYGGHSGRADDYHYHIAPLHLVPTSGNMPIAFALDGYAVYGANEPDGTPMTTLDTNHGHFGTNGVYHYHGTMVYPYMIGNMVGRVTEDTTSQIVPQSSASPVRPAQVPLGGAVITHCLQQGTNGYKLCYTLSGEVDTVSYNWTTAGLYTFNFISPSAGTTTQTYTGFIPCYVLPTRVEDAGTGKRAVRIFPNPAGSTFEIALSGDISANSVNDITLYNMAGQQVWHSGTYTRFVDVHNLPDGVYLLKVISANELFTNKIMIQ